MRNLHSWRSSIHHRGKSSIYCRMSMKNARDGRSVIEGSRVNESCGKNHLTGCLGNSCLEDGRVCLLIDKIILYRKWLFISNILWPVDQHMMRLYLLLNMSLFPVIGKFLGNWNPQRGTPCWQQISTPGHEDNLNYWYLPQPRGPKHLEDSYLNLTYFAKRRSIVFPNGRNRSTSTLTTGR